LPKIGGDFSIPAQSIDMQFDDLHLLYGQLRRELDVAYSAHPWDSARIDRIAEDLLNLERTLVARQRIVPRPPAPHSGMHTELQQPQRTRRLDAIGMSG
jgi:hypothetical protein